jgi:hypothetical protein
MFVFVRRASIHASGEHGETIKSADGWTRTVRAIGSSDAGRMPMNLNFPNALRKRHQGADI